MFMEKSQLNDKVYLLPTNYAGGVYIIVKNNFKSFGKHTYNVLLRREQYRNCSLILHQFNIDPLTP